jgi:hypothetical protein
VGFGRVLFGWVGLGEGASIDQVESQWGKSDRDVFGQFDLLKQLDLFDDEASSTLHL